MKVFKLLVLTFLLLTSIAFAQQRTYISGTYIARPGMFFERILTIKEISTTEAYISIEGGCVGSYDRMTAIFDINGNILVAQLQPGITIEIKKNPDNTIDAILKSNIPQLKLADTYRKIK